MHIIMTTRHHYDFTLNVIMITACFSTNHSIKFPQNIQQFLHLLIEYVIMPRQEEQV